MKNLPPETVFIERLLTVAEVVLHLNISPALAYQLIKKGDIPSVHIGKAVRVRPSDLNKFILRNVSNAKWD